MTSSLTHRGRPKGFTLIEILVVIGIIVILLSILIPVISKVRKQSQAASTQQQIAGLSGAIERYQADHGAYPGPVSNAEITTGGAGTTFPALPTTPPSTPMTAPLTSSENLLLALMGGIRNTSTTATPAIGFSEHEIGTGPSNLNYLKPGRTRQYVDKVASEISEGNAVILGAGGVDVATDSNVPEFVDRFPYGGGTNGDQPMPILYLRARKSAAGVASTVVADADTYQYNPLHLARYGMTFASIGPCVAYLQHPTLTPKVDSSDTPANQDTQAATVNASGTPRQKDKFLLISAGIDRVYGTEDDIISGG